MDYMRYSHLGIVFLLIIFGCIYIGSLLDSRFNTKPLMILLGTGVGFSIGLYQLIKETSPK